MERFDLPARPLLGEAYRIIFGRIETAGP